MNELIFLITLVIAYALIYFIFSKKSLFALRYRPFYPFLMFIISFCAIGLLIASSTTYLKVAAGLLVLVAGFSSMADFDKKHQDKELEDKS